MTDDPRALLERALDQTYELLSGVTADQLIQSTPCRSWDVATLMSHVVHALDNFTRQARGESPDWGSSAPEISENWAAAFRSGSETLLQAWGEAGDLSGTIESPSGPVPARQPVDQQIAELAMHGWDLATATGQSRELDDDVAETALAFGKRMLQPEFRGSEDDGKAFGPEVPVPAGAPIYDRLAGFFGRQPLV